MAASGYSGILRLAAAGTAISILGACADVPVRSGSRPPVSAPGAAAGSSAETMEAIVSYEQLEAELKDLRSMVEVQQFELERLQTRQRELYDDLDQRLRQQERGAGGQPPAVGASPATTQQPAGGALSGAAGGMATPSGQGQVIGGGPTQGAAAGGAQMTTQPVTTIGGTAAGDQAPGQVDSVTVGQPEITVETGQGGSSEAGAGTLTTAAVGQPVSMDEQEAYDSAFGLLKQSRYSDAVVAFEEFIRNYPNSDLTDDAYYWMAEARYVNREFESSLAGFQTVVTRYPDSQRVPASYLKIGYIQYEIGAYDQARQTLTEVMRNFPTHRVAVSAESRLQKMDREGVGLQQ